MFIASQKILEKLFWLKKIEKKIKSLKENWKKLLKNMSACNWRAIVAKKLFGIYLL